MDNSERSVRRQFIICYVWVNLLEEVPFSNDQNSHYGDPLPSGLQREDTRDRPQASENLLHDQQPHLHLRR